MIFIDPTIELYLYITNIVCIKNYTKLKMNEISTKVRKNKRQFITNQKEFTKENSLSNWKFKSEKTKRMTRVLWNSARNLLGLFASVPIVVVGFTFIKEFVSIETWVYLIHSDKGNQFNSYVRIFVFFKAYPPQKGQFNI